MQQAQKQHSESEGGEQGGRGEWRVQDKIEPLSPAGDQVKARPELGKGKKLVTVCEIHVLVLIKLHFAMITKRCLYNFKASYAELCLR